MHALYYCAACGTPLQARACKLQCPVCGYQEDCSDICLPLDSLLKPPDLTHTNLRPVQSKQPEVSREQEPVSSGKAGRSRSRKRD